MAHLLGVFHALVFTLALGSGMHGHTTNCSVTVRPGNTLSGIAATVGTNWQTLARENPQISNPNLIYPGETLTICQTGKQFGVFVPAQTVYSTPNANGYPWGWCTWGAAQLAHDNVNGLGDASQWFANARARGMAVGYVPQVGATVVFQAGYHTSAWGTGTGHVAHVLAVSNGRILIREMNNSYYGGFGKWDDVWVDVHPGMSFIY